eukprot:Em0048g20a
MATPNTASSSDGASRDSQLLMTLVLLGGEAVGKSCLVERFVTGGFDSNHQTTIGVPHLTQTVNVDNRQVTFDMWDTSGQERHHSLASIYCRSTNAAIVVYDITNMDTFTTAKSWVTELRSQASPNIVIALSGNKADLVNKRVVGFKPSSFASKEAQGYAKENNLLFMETSALTAQNAAKIFVAVALIFCKTIQGAANNEDRWSPLMIAREIGHLSPLMIASEIGHYELVKTMIDAGAEVSLTNKVQCMN